MAPPEGAAKRQCLKDIAVGRAVRWARICELLSGPRVRRPIGEIMETYVSTTRRFLTFREPAVQARGAASGLSQRIGFFTGGRADAGAGGWTSARPRQILVGRPVHAR